MSMGQTDSSKRHKLMMDTKFEPKGKEAQKKRQQVTVKAAYDRN